MKLGARGLAVAALLGACSGRTSSHGAPPETAAASGGGSETAGAGAAATSGGSVAVGGGTSGGVAPDDRPLRAVRGCPDASWGNCDAGLYLTLTVDGPSDAGNGVWVEPLRVERPPLPRGAPPADANAGPESWDRSELPAGACVFRVHGAPADCFAERGRLTFGACDPGGPPRPVPVGYYESSRCSEGVAPGCPKQPWGNQSYAWYAVREADDAVTIVLCAGLCETALQANGACMSHAPQIVK